MKDVTEQIDSILPTLEDWSLVVDFSNRASGALRADALGVILGNIAEQAVAVMLNGSVLGGNAKVGTHGSTSRFTESQLKRLVGRN